MKTNKEDRHPQKSDGNVETPPPPQVIDPSVPPENQRNEKPGQPDKKSTRGQGKKVREKSEDPSEQKLAPRDEL